MEIYDWRKSYQQGKRIISRLRWKAGPTRMFRAPSLAKDTAGRQACEELAAKLNIDVSQIAEDFVLACRIDHLIAICGEPARRYFLDGPCSIDRKKIGKLSRRMPPFIKMKITDLLTGSTNMDRNPEGAFDTNGWGEIRQRLPRMRGALEQYSSSLATRDVTVLDPQAEQTLRSILAECDEFQQHLQPVESLPTRQEAAPGKSKAPDWKKIGGDLSRVLGVFRKINRDLKSEFWRKESVLEAEDRGYLLGEVVRTRSSTRLMVSRER